MRDRLIIVALLIFVIAAASFGMDRAEKEELRQHAIQHAVLAHENQQQDYDLSNIDTIVPIDDASILVVVNTPINSWPLEGALLNAFQAMDAEFAYWNVEHDGVFDTDYLLQDWDAVLLFADNTGQFPTRAYDGGAWSQYVIDGGNLFYSDQDYFWANDEVPEPVFAEGDFAYDAFGIASGVNDSNPQTTLFEGLLGDPISEDFVDDPFWTNTQQSFWWEDFVYPINPSDANFFNTVELDESALMHHNMFGGTIIHTAFNCVAAADLINNEWVMTDHFTTLVENVLDYFSQPQPAELTLMPQNTTIPAAGGTLVYDVHFVNNTGNTYTGVSFWTRVTLPNGQMTSVLFQQNFTASPFMDVTVTGLGQLVPEMVPDGVYTFHGHVGMYPVSVLTDTFPFTKEAAAGVMESGEINEADWSSAGIWEVASEGSKVGQQVPSDYALHAAYPNPFNPTTTVLVSLPEATDLTVAVYNAVGQQVAELSQGYAAAGTHAFTFDASALSSGVYFVRALVPGRLNAMQKVVVMK